MHVGVLGGGLQGCCTALALAERGVKVTIIDRNDTLLSRAAVANEGKIHLGYMYAGDPTLGTARMMMRGALAFAPFFARYLGLSPDAFNVSQPAAYLVHRASQHDADEVLGYATQVNELVRELEATQPDGYFGRNLRGSLRRWTPVERAAHFDDTIIVAAFDSPEVAINPVELATRIRDTVHAHPLIDVRIGHTVLSARDEGERIAIDIKCRNDRSEKRFDHAVNALWDGRLALNETFGIRTERPWLHRLKYGVSFRWPSDLARPPSVTVVSGPFGEVVNYADGLTYLTWYPESLWGLSKDVCPPEWATHPQEPVRSSVLQGTQRALAEFVLALRGLDLSHLPEVVVKGGVIVAWGKTDIYDPLSELHRRSEIGVTSYGRFHSVDPGKLTMAPLFAEICADRIKPLR